MVDLPKLTTIAFHEEHEGPYCNADAIVLESLPLCQSQCIDMPSLSSLSAVPELSETGGRSIQINSSSRLALFRVDVYFPPGLCIDKEKCPIQ